MVSRLNQFVGTVTRNVPCVVCVAVSAGAASFRGTLCAGRSAPAWALLFLVPAMKKAL